ncbi:hypothetical protein [Zobellella endophytica]|nr:hypothetical protein [Zobellella endophytica]
MRPARLSVFNYARFDQLGHAQTVGYALNRDVHLRRQVRMQQFSRVI